jgi:hypothetical protein
MLHRESGTPSSWGSSQASALTATTTPGGKAGWAPATRPFVQADESLFEEALSPLTDDLPQNIDPDGNFVIREAIDSV